MVRGRRSVESFVSLWAPSLKPPPEKVLMLFTGYTLLFFRLCSYRMAGCLEKRTLSLATWVLELPPTIFITSTGKSSPMLSRPAISFLSFGWCACTIWRSQCSHTMLTPLLRAFPPLRSHRPTGSATSFLFTEHSRVRAARPRKHPRAQTLPVVSTLSTLFRTLYSRLFYRAVCYIRLRRWNSPFLRLGIGNGNRRTGIGRTEEKKAHAPFLKNVSATAAVDRAWTTLFFLSIISGHSFPLP